MTITLPAKGLFNKHYDAQAEVQCNTCNVATWVINREQLLYKTRNKRGLFLKKFIQSLCAKKPKECEPASTEKPATRESAVECKECKILIVCKGSSFSQKVMDYSITLAAKTRSGLVALSLDEKGRNFSEFRQKAETNSAAFSAQAADAGLHFEHIVEQGSENDVVTGLYANDEAFRYVLDDVDGTMSKKQIIPVYTRATMRAR